MQRRLKSPPSTWVRLGRVRPSRGLIAGLAGLAVVVVLLVAGTAPLALAHDPLAKVDVGPQQDFLTATDVVDAFHRAGLTIQDLRQEPVGGSPSGSPGSEREAWTFVVDPAPRTANHPLAGRIMVFANADGLQTKSDWGQRIGSTFVQHRNILVWLDGDLDAQMTARYRQAITGMR